MTQQPRHGVGLVDRVGITCLCEWTTTFGSGGWPRFNEHLDEATAPDPADSGRWVDRVAYALHEDCELEWQGIALTDPSRAVTLHMADAHWGRAHDLVRRLGPAAAAAPVASPASLDARVTLLEAVVREAAAHVYGLLHWDTARYGARAWLNELPARTGLSGLRGSARLEGQPAGEDIGADHGEPV